MSKQLESQLSDEQLDAISGGSYSRDCDGRGRHNDCDDDRKKGCGGGNGDHHRKHRRNDDDCRPTYRAHRCG